MARDVENDMKKMGVTWKLNLHRGQGPARTMQPVKKNNLHLSKDISWI